MAKAVKPSLGCGYAVAGVMLVLGVFCGVLAGKGFGEAGGRLTGAVVGPGVLAVLLVVGAGAYLRFARRLVAAEAERERRRAEFADRPWLLKKEWQGPAIEAGEGRGVAMVWFFTVVWNALSWPALAAVISKHQEEKGVYFVLLFPLVGLGLLATAIHQTIRWRKFGRVKFVPSTMPGAIGGYLGGVIEVPARVVPETDAKLALRCVRRVTSGSGKNRSTRETVLWEREERVARDQWLGTAGRTDIPVLFYIPAECEPCDDRDDDNEVVWRLSAEAKVPGVDFAAVFDVPVFDTGERAAPPEPGRPLLAEYRGGPPDDAALREAGVERRVDGFGFSAGHLRGTKYVVTALAAGLLVLLGYFVGRDVHWVMWTVSGMFTGVFVLVALDLWCDRQDVVISGDTVLVRRRRPWGGREVRLPRADIASVRADPSMSSGSTQYYRLTFIGRGGVDPAGGVAGEPFAARKLRYQLKRVMKELGVNDPTKAGGRGAEILEKMGRAPRFEVVFAKHVPGMAMAERVGEVVMERLAESG